MSTTHMGVEDDGLDMNEATEALLSQWTDAGTLSADEGANRTSSQRETAEEDEDEDESADQDDQDAEDADDDESAADDEDEDDESATDDEDEDEDGQPTVAGDDAVVEVTVNGEKQKVAVKELKRLFGQEASLTRKSQEVAQARKKADEDGARFTVAAQSLLQRAAQKFEPYSKIDWVVAQSTLQPDELVALRNEARTAYEEVAFLQSQVDAVFQQTQQARLSAHQEAVQAMHETLSDPENGIKDYSEDTYQSIRNFAAKQGVPNESFDQISDPAAIRLLNMARLYAEGQTKLKTTKKALAPKKVLKSKKKPGKALKQGNRPDANRRLRQTGSVADGVEALLARWSNDSDD